MKQVLALAALMLLAAPSAAIIVVVPSSAGKDAEADAPPKPAAPEFRRNQINRCADVRGRVVLQEAPCFTTPASSPAPAADEVALASLEPRRLDELRVPAPSEPAGGFIVWLRSVWWKLALLVLCVYGIGRAWQAVRANYFFRQYAEDRPERAVTRR